MAKVLVDANKYLEFYRSTPIGPLAPLRLGRSISCDTADRGCGRAEPQAPDDARLLVEELRMHLASLKENDTQSHLWGCHLWLLCHSVAAPRPENAEYRGWLAGGWQSDRS